MILITSLVSEIEEFIKNIKNKASNLEDDKNPSNKYKGKEIRSLLTENSKNKNVNSEESLPKRAVTEKKKEEPLPPQEKTKTKRVKNNAVPSTS